MIKLEWNYKIKCCENVERRKGLAQEKINNSVKAERKKLSISKNKMLEMLLLLLKFYFKFYKKL
jgi:hypothetical protein